MPPVFPITKHLDAAALYARDVPIAEIARQMGVTRKTIYLWVRSKEGQERVAEVKAGVIEATKRLAIADKARRIKTLSDLHDKLLTVVEERAADMAGEVAGGGTGLLARQVKQMGRTVVTEYVVDSSVVREIRGLEEQAAKELGDWVEKSEIDGGIDVTTTVQIVGINVDLL